MVCVEREEKKYQGSAGDLMLLKVGAGKYEFVHNSEIQGGCLFFYFACFHWEMKKN